MHDADSLHSIQKGDFPVFYTGAVFASRGNYEELYSVSKVRELQSRYWPALGNTRVHPFAYPPYVAVLLSPLAALGPKAAQAVFVFLMAALTLLSIYVASVYVPLFRTRFIDSAACLVLFAPVTFSIFGSQNTGLSMFCYAGAIASLRLEKKWSEASAGVFIGIWLFKPHFALLALILLSLAGYYKCFFGFSLVAAIYYVIGAAAMGLLWPVRYLSLLKPYLSAEFQQNSYQMVSLNAALGGLAQYLGLDAAASLWPALLHILFSLLILFIAWVYWRYGKNRSGKARRFKKCCFFCWGRL